MKPMLWVCALAVLWTTAGGAQLTTMHEDVLDGYNGSITLSLVTRTMIPKSSAIPDNELWQHFHQIDRPHFIEAYGATNSTLKNVSGVNVRGCEVNPTDTIHIYFTRRDQKGKWSSPNVNLPGDIIVSQTEVSGVGAHVSAHRELAAEQLNKAYPREKHEATRLRDEQVRHGLEGIGPEHTKHLDWIWKVVLNNSNYTWSPGVTASGRYETAVQPGSGNGEDLRMSDIAVKSAYGSTCSFRLGECGYFRLHRNLEEKDGGTADIQKLERPLDRRCVVRVPDKPKSLWHLPKFILQKIISFFSSAPAKTSASK
jgi:hypothetical protein